MRTLRIFVSNKLEERRKRKEMEKLKRRIIDSAAVGAVIIESGLLIKDIILSNINKEKQVDKKIKEMDEEINNFKNKNKE